MKTKTNHLSSENRLVYFRENPSGGNEKITSQNPSNQDEGKEKETLKAQESQSNAPHTIADILKATEKFLGENLVWDLPNGDKLESKLPQLQKELTALNQVLESKAGKGEPGVKEINEFLKEKGFSIRLDEKQANELSISAASVLKLEGQWMAYHKAQKVDQFKLQNGKEVPAIKMTKVESYTIAQHNNPIIKLETDIEGTANQYGFDAEEGPTVYITKLDGKVPTGASGLYSKTTEWMEAIQKTTPEEAKATFPMIDYQNKGDIKELLQGSTIGQDGMPAVINQALFEHILKMNEKGFLAKAAAAVKTTRGLHRPPPKEINIDGPFVMWVEKNGVSAFSAYISEKDMKNPGNFQGEEKK